MEDTIYTLNKLVKAIEEFTKQINVYPQTEKTFKKLENAELELNISLSLAKDILNKTK